MSISNNIKILKALMKKHELTRPDVAALLCMSLSSIDAWLTDNGSTRYRKMPDRMLDLLQYKLGEK